MTQIQYRHIDYSCIYTSIAYTTRVAFWRTSDKSISQRSRIKEDIVEPSVPTQECNLKAYATEDQSINQSINQSLAKGDL